MKICIFTETYYPVMGGGETQAQLLAEGLIDHGHSVILLARRSDATLEKYERYGGLDVFRLGPVGSGQLKKWGLILSGLPALIGLRNRYDLIFVSGYRIIGVTAVIIGKILRKPVILKADSQGEMSGDFFASGLKKFGISHKSSLFKRFLGFRNAILKNADAFSAIAPELASEFTSSGLPSNRIYLIPNSVDTKRFLAVEPEQKVLLREKLNLPQSTTIAIYTGRLVSYKGLPLLLRVWNDMRRKYENILLVLAGTGGLDIHNCEEELHAYVKSEGMDEHVLFKGVIRNVQEYLQASDLFVFPTEDDAFPSSIVEAMSCGLPVIATPVGAIKNIITDCETGLLIQPGSEEQLFQAMDVMLSDRDLASRLGKAASKSVQDLYSTETVTQKYLTLFQSLISG